MYGLLDFNIFLINKTQPRRHMLLHEYLFSVLQVHPILPWSQPRLDSTESDLGSTWGQVIEDAAMESGLS